MFINNVVCKSGMWQQDLKVLEIEKGLPMDQARWRRIIASPTPKMEDEQ